MADVNRGSRPLSPHLQIYRMPLAAITSILNRITGVGLLLGALLSVWWLVGAASGPEHFAFVDGIVTSFIGDLIMFCSVWALWYHALAGLRHLVWDAGYCLEVEMADKLAYGIIGGSVLLTLITAIAV
ncbi:MULTISPECIES: succinate dehydrogenase, cytochrome b556 subunit [unclassified Meridianimarinicoccus]|uniref:succinate dehydrogenase, cytochrome b556 subunit n=1 Tax=unclassified Meridianimarinicoccus TaxID=2923344 RepID=UPI001867594F|nr:succinate dehydrogenase, cytochrome b556 subunit [Fluviibacterium sp. MJW13]